MWPFRNQEQQVPDRNSIEQKVTFLAQNGFRLEKSFSLNDLMRTGRLSNLPAPVSKRFSLLWATSKDYLLGVHSAAISGTSTRSALKARVLCGNRTKNHGDD